MSQTRPIAIPQVKNAQGSSASLNKKSMFFSSELYVGSPKSEPAANKGFEARLEQQWKKSRPDMTLEESDSEEAEAESRKGPQ